MASYKVENGIIKTRVTVAVSSTFKGILAAGTIVVEFDGGVVDGHGMDTFTVWALGDRAICTANPEFAIAEVVKLCLQEDGHVFRLSYDELGKAAPDGSGAVVAAGGDGYQRFSRKWPAAPFTYYINDQGTADIPDVDPPSVDEFDVVQYSFDTWENDAGSYMDFDYQLTTTLSAPNDDDDVNVVDWREPDFLPNSAFAKTYDWYDELGNYNEADMVLNDWWYWAIDGFPGAPDVQNVVTHEVDHVLGLAHVAKTDDKWETMYYTLLQQGKPDETLRRTLWWGDIAGVRKAYPYAHRAGNGLGWESQGGDLAIGNIDGDATPDMVLTRINNGEGNYIFYWIGYDMAGPQGQVTNWSDLRWYPNWIGEDSAGPGAALTNIDADPRPDLVLVWVNVIPSGNDDAYYSVGMNLNAEGWPTRWTEVTSNFQVALETQGAGVAMANLDGDALPDMVVSWADHTQYGNYIWYRVFWDMDETGQYASQSPLFSMPYSIGTVTQGVGLTILNYDADSDPEHQNPSQTLDYVMFWVDNPPGENNQRYRVGWNIQANGSAGSWSREFRQDEGWQGWENAGGGISSGSIDGDGRPDLIAMWVDNPSGEDVLFYRMV